jgi:hypothetical protein
VSNELEMAAGASAGGFLRRPGATHLPPEGTLCANCATPLAGPWCHACGQSAEDFHRSIARLMAEVVESLLHADGRLWRTLPDLMFRPGRLTRAYLEGHRAPQIPPLRLFLVVLLTVFLVGGLTGGVESNMDRMSAHRAGPQAGTTRVDVVAPGRLSPEQRARVKAMIGKLQVKLGGDKVNQAASSWLQQRVINTIDDPERFKLIMEQWSERFAILMLPISAVLLSILFIFQRRFFLFDHTIFSLHSLSAVGVVVILMLLLQIVVGDGAGWLLAPLPVHLFVHMRGVYRTRVFGTLARMSLLFLGSLFAVALLFAGLMAVGLNGMGN